MKRISLIAAAALLVAGAQLHAQAPAKQDTASKKKMAPAAQKAAPAPTPAGAPAASKMAAKPAADTGAKKAKKGGKKGAKKDTTAKKPA